MRNVIPTGDEKVLTSDGILCTIDIDTTITGLGTVIGTLMGEISPDGTMCDFTGKTISITVPVIGMGTMNSGSAVLSSDGFSLDTMGFVVHITSPIDITQALPDFSADCVSVE